MSTSYGDILLHPRKEPPRWVLRAVDALSWGLPVVAALLSIGAGVGALRKLDDCAAVLGIAGGVISAGAVVITGIGSRIRDRRLETALALGHLGVDIGTSAQAWNTSAFQ